MKITVYTVPTCAFCKQEKEYLTSKGLLFEEKNLEASREWLTEMLTVGSNFAGTPVTKIEKDNGQVEVLKGFTKEEFDRVLAQQQPEPPAPQPPVPQPTPPLPEPPPAPTPTPMPISTPPATETPTTAPEPQPTTPPVNDALASILNDLKQKAEVDQPAASQTAAPTIPNFPQ